MKCPLTFVLTALLLAGCGGGGGNGGTTPAAPKSQPQSVTGSVNLMIPGASSQSSAKARYPQFVSPNANSMALSINGGADQLFDVSSSSSLCTATAGGGRTCTLTFGAPAGSDSFAFEIFQGTGGTGTLLAAATTPQTIATGVAFNFSVALNAAVGTVVANLNTHNNPGNCPQSPNSFNGISEGCAGSAPVTLTVYDPSGAQVTGTAAYASPIVLSANDPSLSFSPTQFTAPGQTVTVTYSGAAFGAGITNTINVSLTVAGTVIPFPVLVEHAYLYVANSNEVPGNPPSGNGNIAVYAFGASGNATPVRIISGASTGLSFPVAVKLDSLGNIYVLDNGLAGNAPVINIYPPDAGGNVAPRQITGLAATTYNETCTSMTLDPAQTHLYLVCGDAQVHVYTIPQPPTVSVAATSAQTVGMNDDSWAGPTGAALDATGNLYVADPAAGGNAIYYYSAASLPSSGPVTGYTAIGAAYSMSASFGSWPTTIAPIGVAIDNQGTLYADLVYFSPTAGPADSGNEIALWKTTSIPCTNCTPNGALSGAPFTAHLPQGFALDWNGNAYSANPLTNTISEFAAATLAAAKTSTVSGPALMRSITTTASGASNPIGVAIGL